MSILAAPVQDNVLQTGVTISRDLAGGKVETFKVSVSENYYFRIVVEQQRIELAVALLDPTGRQVIQTKSQSGTSGPLYISAIATSAGDYTLQVRSTEEWANAGRFEIRLESLRLQEPRDSDQVAAERLVADGQTLLEQAIPQPPAEAEKSRQQAVTKFTEAKKLFTTLKDPHGQVMSCYLAGVAYRSLRKYTDAIPAMMQAIELAPGLPPNDWRLEATVRNDLGQIYARLLDEENVRSWLKSALQIFEAHQDRRGKASVFNNLGLSLLRMGEGREAIKLFQNALEIRRLENDKVSEIVLLNNIAGAYDSLGEFREALSYLEQVVAAWRESKNLNLLKGLNNVALIYEKLGLWQQALDYYRESLALVAQTDDRDMKATILSNVGDMYSKLNDHSRALENYEKALSVQREIKKYPSEEAKISAHIGTAYLSLNNLAEALKYLEQALQIAEANPAVKIPRTQAYTLLGIGEVDRLQGKPDEALKYFEQARKFAASVGDLQRESDSQQKLGETYVLLRDWTKAQESYDAALTLRRKLEDRLGQATTLYHIASLKRDQNQLVNAAAASAEALKQFEALRESIASQQLRTSYFETTQQCFELFIDVRLQLYKIDSDSSHLTEAFAANEQARARSLVDILAQTSPRIRQGVNPALLQKKQALFENLNSKARKRQELLNEREVQQRAYDQGRKDQKLALADTDQRLTVLAAGIKQLISDADDLDTQIRRDNPKYAALTQPQPLNLKEVQTELLDDNTLLLEYSLGDRRSFAFVVSTNSIKAIELPKRAEIDPVVRRLGAALTARNVSENGERPAQRKSRLDKANSEYLEAATVLSKMVIDPVASLLGKKRILVVADGALQLIPFAVLPVSINSNRLVATAPRQLIEDYEIVTLPSASVLGVQRRELKGRKVAPHAVAVLADPVFESSDSRVQASKPTPASLSLAQNTRGAVVSWLPYSKDEAKAIERVAPAGETMLALDFKASRATAMSPTLSQYRIVHFATHGVADPDHPELSEIILSLVDEKGVEQDGRVRLYEIYDLNLPVELVVLSACESGVGKQIKGEGLIALTRGFMYAGAARVVASLWKVDDSATAALMAEFYKEMFTNGREPAAALRAAQLSISKQRRWNDPYFWAGFVIQGEWR